MTEQSVKFYSYDDICTRKAFSATGEISPNDFKKLVGQYAFNEEHICQVRTDKGICRQKHKKGWVGVTNDGVEVLIGCLCANKYFNANANFVMEKNRVIDELARKDAMLKMSLFLTDKLSMALELLKIEQSLHSISKKIEAIYKLLPGDVLSFLYQSQRTSNWDVFVDVQYLKDIKDDEGNDTVSEQWIASRLGKVKYLSSQQFVESLHEKSVQLKKFYNSFSMLSKDELTELKTIKLKSYVKRIEQKYELEQQCNILSTELDNFLKNDNLELLIYACDSPKEQYYAVQAIMKLSGLKAEHSSHVDRRLNKILSKFEQKFKGRLIRKSIRG
ncbi:hypothetical protein E0U70_20060 [Salmonella enterica subsp. enterica serovar Gloucester]|nr:hypothetical protein [Salmonella enterica subsp. enterica serovar Gloucester]